MEWFAVFLVTGLIAAALAPRPPKAAPPAALEDFNAPTADEGRPVPVIFGTVLIKSANVVWYGDLKIKAIRTKSSKK